MKRRSKDNKKSKDPVKETKSLRRQVTELKKCESRHRLAEKKLARAYKTYRNTIEKAPFGIYIINKAGKVEYVNPAMLKIAGDSRKVFMGLKLLELPPYKELGLSGRIKAGFRGKYFHMGPVEYTSYVGRKTTVRNFMGVPLEENGGKKVLVFVEDITTYKKAEEALQQSENKFRQFFENDPDYCYMVSSEGKILDVNKAALKALKCSKKELLGRSLITSVYAPSSRKKAKKLFLKWKRTGKIENEELDIIAKTGEERTVLLNVNAVKDAGGEILHSISVQSDITERKKAEETLKDSEEEFRAVFDDVKDGLALLDMSGRIVKINRGLAEIGGYSEKDLVGRRINSLKMFTPASIKKMVSDFIRTVSGRKKPFLYEVEGFTKTGEKKYLEIQSALLRKRKRPTGVVTVVRDVSERRKAEEAIREFEQRFKAIYDNATDGVYLVDPETRKTYMANRMFCRLVGYSEKELEGMGIEDIHDKKDLPYVLDQFNKLYRREINLARDMPVKRKDGSFFYADISAAPITLSGKGYLMGFFRDVTERKKVEQLKDEFVNTVSHELRTPLALIRESVFIAMKKMGDNVSSEQEKFFDITKRNVDRLDHLINDVLDYQKLVAGRMSFDMRKWDVNRLAEEIGKDMLSLAEEKGVGLTTILAEDLPDVKLDGDRITQVLMNLVGNAIKFTDKGRVTIITAKDKGGVRVSVKDTGIGIKTEEMDKLFQSFSQIIDAEGRKAKGTGLGLVISRKIIEQHGGRIWGESEHGKGSTFSFFLPAA